MSLSFYLSCKKPWSPKTYKSFNVKKQDKQLMPYALFSAAWCGCCYMDLCKVHPLEWTLEKLLGLTDEILRGAFLMAIKGHFGIQDKDRMKRWMRKYREQGESDYSINVDAEKSISTQIGTSKS